MGKRVNCFLLCHSCLILSRSILWPLSLFESCCCCCSIAQSYPNLSDPWTVTRQAPLSSTNSWHLFKFMSIESVMLSNHLISAVSSHLISATPFPLCLQSFPASESFSVNQLCIRWPKCQSFSFSISPSKEYSGLISFRMTGFISFKSKRFSRVFQAPQFKNISTSVLSLLYGPILTSVMTTGKIIALTIWTIGKVIYLLFSTLSRFVIAFLPGMRVF